MHARRVLIVGVCLSLLAAGKAMAHDFTITAVNAQFDAAGNYQIDMTVDLDALALGAPPGTDSRELANHLAQLPPAELADVIEALKSQLEKRTRIRFDGQPAPDVAISFPEHRGAPSEHTEYPSFLGVTARFSGAAPVGAQTFTFWASRAFQAVHLTITREGSDVETTHILGVGDESPAYSLTETQKQSNLRVATEYAVLGFEHIVPRGIDHILFVLGLFLLSPKLKPLLWQVTAFTIAHTLTLALSMFGVISLPSSIVEPLIALSIAVVAIENIATPKLHPWRPAIVFGFGLLHGLGFAGVLTELGLPREQFVVALLSFNVGVEAGQLAVIGVAILLVGWARHANWYRARISIPASISIAALALYVTMQRSVIPDLPALI